MSHQEVIEVLLPALPPGFSTKYIYSFKTKTKTMPKTNTKTTTKKQTKTKSEL